MSDQKNPKEQETRKDQQNPQNPSKEQGKPGAQPGKQSETQQPRK